MKKEYCINACCGKRIDVTKGQTISIIDVEGGQVVDFFAESAIDPNEFLSTGVTIDCNGSLRLKEGDFIYSNRYHPMFLIVEDDMGEHDLLHPCCRPEMYDFFYHNGENHPNCLDNINQCLGECRPIIYPVNLFMHSHIDENGSVSVKRPRSRAGDRIVMKVQMDVHLGIAACSVCESDCNSGKCTPVKIIVSSPPRS